MTSMPVERGKIREYAAATGNARPEYMNDPCPPIPPTFLSTVVFWDTVGDVFASRDAVDAFAAAGITPGWEGLLSVEQEYRFDGALPCAGDTLELVRRFDGVETKEGRRGGRMVFVRFAIEFRDGDGSVRAECRYRSAYLGAAASSAAPRSSGGSGARPPAADAARPASDLPERRFGPVTMTDIVRYQGASGDFNPMHHDDALARSAGYPEAFSVGMLTAGYLATACTDVYGTESVRRFGVRFRDLVWRGDALVAAGTIRGEQVVGGERRVVLDLSMTTEGGSTPVTGVAEFALP
ncbi:MAG: MaoC family dehydratase N-terminal domain-containing protein [Acidimicrobiia bacterium]|nr:MaoC family dehydratase N-terminal domain-containing protein [Acidimicrobiia bacterium]